MLKQDWTCGLIKWDQCALTYNTLTPSKVVHQGGGANEIPTMLFYLLISHIMVIQSICDPNLVHNESSKIITGACNIPPPAPNTHTHTQNDALYIHFLCK